MSRIVRLAATEYTSQHAHSMPLSNFITSNLQYNTGGPCDVVIVRLFYQWPLFVTGLGFNLSNLSGGKRLLWSSAAFRNEPYGTCAAS